MQVIKIIGFTFIQIALMIIFFVLGKEIYFEFRPLRFDIGRGLFWYYHILLFCFLTFFANCILEIWSLKFSESKRLIVWSILFSILAIYSFQSFSAIPLSVLFINLCAIFSILISEIIYVRLTSVSSGLGRGSGL